MTTFYRREALQLVKMPLPFVAAQAVLASQVMIKTLIAELRCNETLAGCRCL